MGFLGTVDATEHLQVDSNEYRMSTSTRKGTSAAGGPFHPRHLVHDLPAVFPLGLVFGSVAAGLGCVAQLLLVRQHWEPLSSSVVTCGIGWISCLQVALWCGVCGVVAFTEQ